MESHKQYPETLLRALKFATDAHKGQTRKGSGEAYMAHPLAVLEKADQVFSKIKFLPQNGYYGHGADKNAMWDSMIIPQVALLHDIMKDTAYEFNDIEDKFGLEVAQHCWTLVHSQGECYTNYLKRIHNTGEIIPIVIKIADMQHNLETGEGVLSKWKLELYRTWIWIFSRKIGYEG